MVPNLAYEQECWNESCLAVGVDEVGRGAFAGPLVMAGVVIDMCDENKKKEFENLEINDSKKLSPKKREKLTPLIKEKVFTHSLFTVDATIINRVGIGVATQIAVNEIILSIKKKIQNRKLILLMDGMPVKVRFDETLIGQKAIIGGDSRSISIAAASILAKVHRDALMKTLSYTYPQYGFETHVGYGTRDHREAILKYGVCEEHRTEYLKKLLSTIS